LVLESMWFVDILVDDDRRSMWIVEPEFVWTLTHPLNLAMVPHH
jgi:hypothetical protein